ncbi:MAG: wax ester/triacylglycerol synthase family O-acyltransferase [Rubrivivax sp.]|nr:wax ester/triacylglycerol synthase family O-acyltransferase [Rubrivivax sp.]
MSRVDTAWLRMDNDVNLMMIVGVWLLAPAITLAALRERIESKLLKYDRFRQKAVHDALGAMWVDDESFDLDRHVVATPLPREKGQGERAALQALCGRLAAEPLDPERPLWKFHLIEHYEGGSAILMRIHHCIGDGIALMTVMLSITDGGADPPRRRRNLAAAAEAHHGAGDGHEGDWLSDAVLKPLTDLTVKAIGMTGSGIGRSMEVLANPQALTQGMGGVDLAQAGLQVAKDAAALALLDDDSPTRLKGKGSGRKVVAWCEPIPLEMVKAIGKAMNCTVNDVLLSCVAGAIGGWLRASGEDLAGKEIRAMVPVNLRPLDKAWQLGNRFGLAPLVLPVGIANPVQRMYAVHARMAEMKGSYQPLLAFAILSVSGLLIKPVQDMVLGLFAKKTTAVMTNVPGPAKPLLFCGSTLRQTMFWVPSSGDIGVGVSVLSYGGGVQFGLITDEKLCPRPQEIIDRFEPEFEQLLLVAMMLPWAGEPAGETASTPAAGPPAQQPAARPKNKAASNAAVRRPKQPPNPANEGKPAP